MHFLFKRRKHSERSTFCPIRKVVLLGVASSLSAFAAGVGSQLEAAGWPQFRGAARDGTAAADGIQLVDAIPEGGLDVRWRHRVGSGFAGPVVDGDRVFIFHREGDEAVVEALEKKDGQPVWNFRYPCRYRDDFGFDDGPRTPPTDAVGRVFVYGPEGMLHCLGAADETRRTVGWLDTLNIGILPTHAALNTALDDANDTGL